MTDNPPKHIIWLLCLSILLSGTTGAIAALLLVRGTVQGAAGPQGERGEPGPAGESITGPTGPQGIQGLSGKDGIVTSLTDIPGWPAHCTNPLVQQITITGTDGKPASVPVLTCG